MQPQLDEIDAIETSVDELLNTAQVPEPLHKNKPATKKKETCEHRGFDPGCHDL
jgi:hypothetical protein